MEGTVNPFEVVQSSSIVQLYSNETTSELLPKSQLGHPDPTKLSGDYLKIDSQAGRISIN